MNLQINDFPDELLINIFSHLNPNELANASLASKKWHNISCDDLLWKELFKGVPVDNDDNGFRNALFQMKKITDYQQVIEDFEAFSDTVEENQKADYECLFLKNPGCFLNIKFGLVRNPKDKTSIKRQVLFIKELPFNGSMIYGMGREKRIQARLPSSLSEKMINKSGDQEIIRVMRALYGQVARTDYALDIRRRTLSQIQTIQTAISTGVAVAFVFGLAYYNIAC